MTELAMMSQIWYAPFLEMVTHLHLTSSSLYLFQVCQASSIVLTLIFVLCSLSHSQLPNH